MKVTTDACLFGAWVADRCEMLSLSSQESRALDIGAGTGLLSLMLAQRFGGRIDAIELDSLACREADENRLRSPWPDRVHMIAGDIKSFQPGHSYDLVISNPPFYENEIPGSDRLRNQAHHRGGLLLKELFALLPKLLHPGGRFFLLLPFKRRKEIATYISQSDLEIEELISVIPSSRQEASRLFMQGRHRSARPALPAESRMFIREESDAYSEAFIRLLKDYYLYL